MILPSTYHHSICYCESSGNSSEDVCDIDYKLRLKLPELDDVTTWLAAFEESSHTTWKKSKTYPGRSNKYRVHISLKNMSNMQTIHKTGSISIRDLNELAIVMSIKQFMTPHVNTPDIFPTVDPVFFKIILFTFRSNGKLMSLHNSKKLY